MRVLLSPDSQLRRPPLSNMPLTFAHHTQVVMQSSFKPRPPSFIEEIERDLRATTMQASHIIFMGYSLPPDDVTYRAFLSARRQRDNSVYCTVVDKDDKSPGWYGPEELKMRIEAWQREAGLSRASRTRHIRREPS